MKIINIMNKEYVIQREAKLHIFIRINPAAKRDHEMSLKKGAQVLEEMPKINHRNEKSTVCKI